MGRVGGGGFGYSLSVVFYLGVLLCNSRFIVCCPSLLRVSGDFGSRAFCCSFSSPGSTYPTVGLALCGRLQSYRW